MDLQQFVPLSFVCSNKFKCNEDSCSYRTEKIVVEVKKSDVYSIKIAVNSHMLPVKKRVNVHKFIRDYVGIGNASASASEYACECSEVNLHQLDKLQKCIGLIDRLPPLVMRNIDLSDILSSDAFSCDLSYRYKETHRHHLVSDI